LYSYFDLDFIENIANNDLCSINLEQCKYCSLFTPS